LEIVGARRTQLHSSIGFWMNAYEFPKVSIPDEVSLADNMTLVNYLIEKVWYIKENFFESGIYLFSPAIVDCIVKLLFIRRMGQTSGL
jgi:hypothetical protein